MHKNDSNEINPIAIYLPQFHPVPENDKWWGKGFTEWTNVTKSTPLFKNHYQPHYPSDLGYYDLRLEESRMAQIALAKQYGIYGFCYYHYWFNGKRLLKEPIDRMLNNSKEDFPFMVCWANENWTRKWDGKEHEVLIKQTYSLEDDKRHINFLCKNFFRDKRYIRKQGKPFIIIYRPSLFPNLSNTLELWRSEAIRKGIGELFIGSMNGFGFLDKPEKSGFDCSIQFEPNFNNLPTQEFPTFSEKLLNKLKLYKPVKYKHKIISYPKYVDHAIASDILPLNIYPGITPGWDNSARRKDNATIFIDSTPEEYGRWLKSIKNKYQTTHDYLFINAWNEWAEGNHLEPCLNWGTQYLEITQNCLFGPNSI